MDSGAVDNVTGKDVAKHLSIRETMASRAGVNYVAANGTKIGNYGDKVITGVTGNGLKVSMATQVTDVNKTLSSAYRLK